MKDLRLSVVIVNYNVRFHLEQCLRSVFRALVGIPSEVWVVDNASTDGSVDYLRLRFPQVRFIANKENYGFSRANNQAIRQCTGKYVLLLNPDTLVAEDTFRVCLGFLDTHPRVGATGVRMLHPDGSFAPESRRGLPTPFTSFCKMSGLGSIFPNSRVFGRYYMRYLDPEKPNRIEVISGAFNMIRREVLEEIGFLDEDFFMYGEDIDLSYRILKAGWQNYYLPCPILHYKGESTQKNSYCYVHVFYQAMLIFFNKHYRHRHFILAILIRMAVYARALLDMWQRWFYRLRIQLHCPPRFVIPGYIRFDYDSVTVKEMLEKLHNQPHGKRLWIETVSRVTGVCIRPGEVIPWDGKEEEC